MVSVTAQHLQNLSRLFAGDLLNRPFVLNGDWLGYFGMADDAELDAWITADLPGICDRLLTRQSDPDVFTPPVVEFVPIGVHYVDELFGAKVYRTEHTIWSDLLPGSLRDLMPVNLDTAPLWEWTLTAMARVLERLPAGVMLTGPIFSSPLNVAINLFGEEGLMDILDPDKGTLRGLAAITETIAELHRRLQALFPIDRVRFYCSCSRYAPDGVGHICGCSTQLLGPETYALHIAPLDDQVLRAYPGGGTIHLCGHHTQHIPCWRAMPALRGVQLNDAAADDFPAYYVGLRDDQVIYLAPTERMPITRILEISKGRRVVLQWGEKV